MTTVQGIVALLSKKLEYGVYTLRLYSSCSVPSSSDPGYLGPQHTPSKRNINHIITTTCYTPCTVTFALFSIVPQLNNPLAENTA